MFQIRPGCDVPPRYYLTNQTSTSHDEMEKVVVSRGSSHKLTFDVMEAKSLLVWEFVSIDHDIGFGVFFFVGEGKKEVAVVSCPC